MDVTFGGLILVALALVFVANSLGWVGRRRDPMPGPTQRHHQAGLALERVMGAIGMLAGELDAEKLRPGARQFTDYYIGYIDQIARSVARHHAIEFDRASRLPVLREVGRLYPVEADNLDGCERELAAILDQHPAERGAEDAKIDTAEALDETFDGPYWDRVRQYFSA